MLPGRAPARVRRWGGRGGVCVKAIGEEGRVWVRAAGMESSSVIKNRGKSRAGRETHISYVHVVFVSWVHVSIKSG